MLRTFSDWIFWQDTSPEWQEYLNQPWSSPSAPIYEATLEVLEAFRNAGESISTIAETYAEAWGQVIPHRKTRPNPIGPAYRYTVNEAGGVIVGNAGAEAIIPIQPIFTADLGGIEDGSGTDTHDDRGRPVLGPSGGVPQAASLCPRHGLPMVSGWCRRCRS